MSLIIGHNVTSPLGLTTEENYQAALREETGLKTYPAGLWGSTEPVTASLFEEARRQGCRATRFESLAIRSIREALQGCDFDIASPRVVLVIGSTKGNILEGTMGEAAERIARAVGITTLPVTSCNACISGLSALILANRLIDIGSYDYAIACGADVLGPFILSGFLSLKALSPTPCKPFDMERNGLNLGEAAATVILANYTVQVSNYKAEATTYEIRTGCIRNDATHISTPSRKADGAIRALRAVAGEAGREEWAVINAHGTATIYNDYMEATAISQLFSETVPVNVLKGYWGHTLGAAGLLETIITLRALSNGLLLPTRGFTERGVSGKIDIVSSLRHTDKRSFCKLIAGFGGGNAAIAMTGRNDELYKSYKSDNKSYKIHTIHITPYGATIDGTLLPTTRTGKALLTELYKRYADGYTKFYKMDILSRLAFIAADLLVCAEKKSGEEADHGEDRGVVLFGCHSTAVTDRAYQQTIADKENYFPSPSLFVYTLPNVAAGEIAIRHGYHGETSFYLLPRRDEATMEEIVRATFMDSELQSLVTGWIDCPAEEEFEADLKIEVRQR